MGIVENLFGDSLAINLIVITVLLAIALALLVWLIRKLVAGPKPGTKKGRQPRLGVIDAAVVDDRRRLVLVRRDSVEHLVMIGGPNDILIEPGIVRNQPVRAVRQQRALVSDDAPATEIMPDLAADISGLTHTAEPVAREGKVLNKSEPASQTRSVAPTKPEKSEPNVIQNSVTAASAVVGTISAADEKDMSDVLAEKPIATENSTDTESLTQTKMAADTPNEADSTSTIQASNTHGDPGKNTETPAVFASNSLTTDTHDTVLQAHTETPDDDLDFDHNLEAALELDLNSETEPANAQSTQVQSEPIQQTQTTQAKQPLAILPDEAPEDSEPENMEDEMQKLLDELTGGKK